MREAANAGQAAAGLGQAFSNMGGPHGMRFGSENGSGPQMFFMRRNGSNFGQPNSSNQNAEERLEFMLGNLMRGF